MSDRPTTVVNETAPAGAPAVTTILIVDDVWTNRVSLGALLRDQGHRVLEAADGHQGLAVVASERPDLVITDVLMPVMDGEDFVRELRLDPTTRRIPVLFYTAPYGLREARALAASSGAAGVLTKPAEPAEVLAAVGRLLAGVSETETVSDGPQPQTTLDREHLRLFSDKRAEQVVDLRTARLRALINIGLDLASERDPDRLLQRVCIAACDLFGATYVTLGILDSTGQTLQHVASCGTDAVRWIKKGDKASGLLATVIAERRVVRGENVGGDPAALRLPSAHPEVRAFLAAPIASAASVYGWICLVGNEGRSFTEEDEHLVQALSGHVGRIYELENEILERNRAESALRRERDRAQRYLDTVDVILLALDLDGRITLINRKGCHLLGWTERELLGRNWVDTCLPARYREDMKRKLEHLLAGDLSMSENPILTRSGRERPIEWCNTLVRDDDGRVIGTLSSGTDILKRNLAVETLRAAEERMRFALEAADVGIWDMDFATGTLRWSEIMEAQYGLPAGAFGETLAAFVDRVHPEDRDALLETMATANRTGTDFSLQHRAIWPDGTVRWINGAGRIHLDTHGVPIRGVGISMDVTERRLLERQYQQAQKMEAIGQLAGGVAHDFNNVLTAILGHCELLLADFPSNDPRQADVIEIQKAGESAARLTRQLLAFSRKEIIEPTLLDLNLVVDSMRVMLRRLIPEDVTVVLGLRSALARVKADRGQVEQVILNLAVNARDAMPAGGTLTIETDNVEIDEHYPRTHVSITPGAYVALTVSDTGTGMTPHVQAHLFEPFFTTKESGKGTGLGLATVHGIAMQNGGSIDVYSELGKGSSFKVYFPRADAPATIVDAPPRIARPHATTGTVLVVEDADGLRDLTRRLLQRKGYTAFVAANAEEAIRTFEENPSIDVLLTDVVMPGSSGPELARRLVERRPGLKVLYMSGYTEASIVHRGVLNTGIAFLHKPFTSETLGRKISDVLDS